MAGPRVFASRIDIFIERFQKRGYEVRVWRTQSALEFSTFFDDRDMKNCAAVIVAGGDGSVNQIVNALLKHNLDIPIGVIPAGTANDFATHIGIGDNYLEAIERLAQMKTKAIDVGWVNDQYFINVCCGGLFSNISHEIDIELKNTLGKLAYYIKGVQQLPGFKPMKLKIEFEEETVIDSFYMFFFLNGSSAGGFNRLGKDAQLDDGRMDFVGIRACSVNDIPVLFAKILIGDHFEDKNVLYRQSKQVMISCLDGLEGFETSDIDGEIGPVFPLDIHVYQQHIKVLY